MSFSILYVGCGHPLLVSDMCLMWEKLGINWFPTCYYTYTDQPGDLPFIKTQRNESLLRSFYQQKRWVNSSDRPDTLCGQKNFQWTNQVAENRFKFTKEFLDQFDAILFDFFIENIIENASVLKGRKVFLRTFAMHSVQNELRMFHARRKGLCKIIRNSPKEHLLISSPQRNRKFGGVDAMIRGSVVRDEHEISGWNGNTKKVCTFTSWFDIDDKDAIRRKQLHQEIAQLTTVPCEVYGIGRTFLTHDQKVQTLRDYRVNLVTGTPNANNTYSFVEAWVMGQPIVCYGRDMWSSRTYEADELIEHGKTGFIGNTPQECAKYINLLMENDNLAHEISSAAREKAVSIYGREVLSQQWRKFFRDNGLKV